VRPLFVDPPTALQRWVFGATSRRALVPAVKEQLRVRDEGAFVLEWDIEDDVDLHIAFKVIAILEDAWGWPKGRVIPADPFALLNPMSTGPLDDGLDAVDCVVVIENALGLPALPDSFWASAYSRTIADVVRFLEAELSARSRQT
jgi:hypothetical protein